MTVAFSSASGTLLSLTGVYSPVRRDTYKMDSNGLEVTVGQRSCNEISGKFYLYNYSLDDNGVLQSVAIDFVQYCEKDTTHGLYGSFRYNSSIPSSCTSTGCDAVKTLFGIPVASAT